MPPHASKKLLNELLHANDLTLPDSVIGKIFTYINLIDEWSKKINLTGHKSTQDILEKDIIDQLYLDRYIKTYIHDYRFCLDMGCGAGFTGIVLGLINPETTIGFLESDRKKMNFVKEACRQLHMNSALFFNFRAESLPAEWKEHFNLSVSRATWQLPEYTNLARHYVQNNGHIIFMAGKNQKNATPETLDYQGIHGGEEIFYKIKPKNYERRIFLFTKIEELRST